MRASQILLAVTAVLATSLVDASPLPATAGVPTPELKLNTCPQARSFVVGLSKNATVPICGNTDISAPGFLWGKQIASAYLETFYTNNTKGLEEAKKTKNIDGYEVLCPSDMIATGVNYSTGSEGIELDNLVCRDVMRAMPPSGGGDRFVTQAMVSAHFSDVVVNDNKESAKSTEKESAPSSATNLVPITASGDGSAEAAVTGCVWSNWSSGKSEELPSTTAPFVDLTSTDVGVPIMSCPKNTFVRGVRCVDLVCDAKDVLCCPELVPATAFDFKDAPVA